MSNPAAASLVAVLQAIEGFVSDLGTDPAQIPLRFPGAMAVLLGKIQLQIPALAVAELGSAQAAVHEKIESWIKSLQSQA